MKADRVRRGLGSPVRARRSRTAACGRQDGAPENSLAAFEAACEAGYGIELDVQLTSDGEAMVFHDARLERMTGREGRVGDHTAADLAAMQLAGRRGDHPDPGRDAGAGRPPRHGA